MNLPLPWTRLLPASLPTPCFVADEDRLRANLAILHDVRQRSGANILLALKGFAMFSVFPLLRGTLQGTCASSPHEARLGREEFGGETHVFAAAYSDEDMREIVPCADHILFNSFAQYRHFRPLVEWLGRESGRSVGMGLRVNPEHSEGAVPMYDPCAPGSRLGIRRSAFAGQSLEGVSSLHFHTLCEQDAAPLARTLAVVEEKFGEVFPAMRHVNFGGGHHITRPGYDVDLLCSCVARVRERHGVEVYLEPGEAVALNAGVLASAVLDVVEADMPIAVLDASAAAHMPDVLEMPYRPNVIDATALGAGGPQEGRESLAGKAGEKAWTCRLAGKSCLAGDVVGEYSFDAPLKRGDRVIFLDMAHYTMVKTTTFNGLGLPAIALAAQGDVRLARRFGYEDFKGRLS
jgi:carboxynorspermidine decarboxylase